MFLHQVPENQATFHEKYGTEEPQRLHDIKYVGGRDVIGILCTKWCIFMSKDCIDRAESTRVRDSRNSIFTKLFTLLIQVIQKVNGNRKSYSYLWGVILYLY